MDRTIAPLPNMEAVRQGDFLVGGRQRDGPGTGLRVDCCGQLRAQGSGIDDRDVADDHARAGVYLSAAGGEISALSGDGDEYGVRPPDTRRQYPGNHRRHGG